MKDKKFLRTQKRIKQLIRERKGELRDLENAGTAISDKSYDEKYRAMRKLKRALKIR